MRILISDQGKIPAFQYGGTERVIWYLGQELHRLGHEVTFLVKEGSTCPFAKVIALDNTKPIAEQIPSNIDLAHFNYPATGDFQVPVIFTNHGNRNGFEPFHANTVFVSANHAARYGSAAYVHNGLDWDDYGQAQTQDKGSYFHFLGNAAWRVKNLRGAIRIISSIPGEKLAVLGGQRFNFKMGMRFTFHPRMRFYGMVGGEQKLELIRHSKGLLFPVLWHEPFGLAIVESLFLGCPVLSTPYGSLPELVPAEVGFLSANAAELADAARNIGAFSRQRCHEYALANFNAAKMTQSYLQFYEKVLQGKSINDTAPVLQQAQPKYLPFS